MWAIRILVGPQAGQVIPLANGAPKVGRGASCEIKIASSSVSKEHAQLHVTEDKLIVADLDSRNGTFVNGVRVQRQILKAGDRVALHDVIFDVVRMANVQAFPAGRPASTTNAFSGAPYPGTYPASYPVAPSGSFAGGAYPPYGAPHPHSFAGVPQGAVAPDLMAAGAYDPRAATDDLAPADAPPETRFSATSLAELWRAFLAYVDDVAMPGVYSLAKKTQFRYVLAVYVGAFVALSTIFSTAPMSAAMKASMQAESQRRALTIARNLALINRQAIMDGLEVSIVTQFAENEDGVEAALVLGGKDGRVIAPANRSGSYADRSYILRVRKKARDAEAINDREYVEQVDSSKIVAAVPIRKFNAEGAGPAVAAYAVVVYDMSAVSIDGGRTALLLGQTLTISLAFGFLLLFFLAKTVEHPILALNAQLSDALREGKDDLYVEFQFPELSALASNVNSALSRIGRGSPDVAAAPSSVDRDAEAEALVSAIPGPAIAVNAYDLQIIFANDGFVGLIAGGGDLRRRSLADVADQALRDHVRSLVDRLRADPSSPASDQIPFAEGSYASTAVAVSGGSEPAYFLVSLRKLDEGGG